MASRSPRVTRLRVSVRAGVERTALATRVSEESAMKTEDLRDVLFAVVTLLGMLAHSILTMVP